MLEHPDYLGHYRHFSDFPKGRRKKLFRASPRDTRSREGEIAHAVQRFFGARERSERSLEFPPNVVGESKF